MLLDISLQNIFANNIGTTLTNYIYSVNLINNNNVVFTKIFKLISVTSLWLNYIPAWKNQNEIILLSMNLSSYYDKVLTINNLPSSFYALDYFHSYFLKQIFHEIILNNSVSLDLSFNKKISYLIPSNLIFNVILTKWAYTFLVFLISYFLTNIMQFRLQFSFNFFFNYFKLITDLGEQEYGSYDDFLFFLFFLIQLFIWYCWVIFIGYTFLLKSNSYLILFTLTIMLTILLIPIKLIWDFGLAFGMYIRGSGSSSSLIAEMVFDVLGVIIIFTRFIVQNIRFLLVFFAFFELFEWSALTFDFITLTSIFDINNYNLYQLDVYSFVQIAIIFVKSLIIYLYHLLHLVIISIMQIGVYLMVSFWLFFFLYTSFFKITVDTYFFNKR